MTICCTQAEVDAAAQRGDLIEIDDTWRGSSSAVLRGSSRAELWDSSSAVLWGSSRAELWDSSSAVLRGSSSAVLWGSSRAVLWDSSRAELRGSSRAELWDSSRAVLRGWLTTAQLVGPRAVASGSGRWLRVTDGSAWASHQGLDVDDGRVTLYKAVSADGTGGHGHGVVYAAGETVTAADWDPSHRECGGGLHLCATPEMARRHGKNVARVLACEVALDDIAVFEPNLDKVRCRSVRVVGEVTE